MPFRRRFRLAALVVLLLVGVATGWWRYRVTRPEYRLERGETAVRAGQWEVAETYADRLEASGYPDHARFLRAERYLARKRPESALAALNEVRDEELRKRSLPLVGRCLLELGSLRDAHEVFTTIRRDEPDNIDAHRGLAAIAYDLGQMDDAIAHLEAVARLDPGDPRPHRLMGSIYLDSDKFEKSEAAFREALRRGAAGPVRTEVRFELADALVHLGRFSDALAELDAEPSGIDPEPVWMLALRAECLRGVGRRAEAAALADQQLVTTGEAAFFRIRGQIDMEEGEYPAAVAMLERATRLNPGHYQSHFLLAQAYAGAGRKADAEAANVRADELRRDLDILSALSRQATARPWDPAVRLRLAEVFDRIGKPELAQMWRSAAAACAGQRATPARPGR